MIIACLHFFTPFRLFPPIATFAFGSASHLLLPWEPSEAQHLNKVRAAPRHSLPAQPSLPNTIDSVPNTRVICGSAMSAQGSHCFGLTGLCGSYDAEVRARLGGLCDSVAGSTVEHAQKLGTETWINSKRSLCCTEVAARLVYSAPTHATRCSPLRTIPTPTDPSGPNAPYECFSWQSQMTTFMHRCDVSCSTRPAPRRYHTSPYRTLGAWRLRREQSTYET